MRVEPGMWVEVRHPAYPPLVGLVTAIEDRGGRHVAVLDVPGAETVVLSVEYLGWVPVPLRGC